MTLSFPLHVRLVPDGLGNKPQRPFNGKARGITIHQTGNTADSATAAATANWIYNGSSGGQTSWHFTVDHLEAWQHLLTTEQGWHAGDGAGPGNTTTIAIEICDNLDGDFYTKAWRNAAELTAWLQATGQVQTLEVSQHNRWSGKNCPQWIRERGLWPQFLWTVDAFAEGPTAQEDEMTADEIRAIVREELDARGFPKNLMPYLNERLELAEIAFDKDVNLDSLKAAAKAART